uniref:UV radiation resistance associated protein n=1 Tax=Plectus sambesii TaxID=2011161 RepID=A0A914VLX6_9BILA
MDENEEKRSYSLGDWQRLRTVCRALRQTEENVVRLKAEIEANLSTDERSRDRQADVQSSRLAMFELEQDVETAKRRVLTANMMLTKMRYTKEQADADRRSFEDSIGVKRDDLADRLRNYIATRENLVRCSAQLVSRRKHMLDDVKAIYRIEIGQPHKAVKPTCPCTQLDTICGTHLPNGDMLAGHNEMELSAALGNAAHVLCAISRMVDIPLRYPIKYAVSRSAIVDVAWPKFPDAPDSVYPLFLKNQDREAFEYGVFLLNKNVAQLRADCSLRTADLSKTLSNLYHLIVHLCGAKILPLVPSRGLMSPPPGSAHSSNSSSTGRRRPPTVGNGSRSASPSDSGRSRAATLA